MRALLLIGLQIDFLPGSETMAAMAREIMDQYDLVVAARFWLPTTHLSFAANHSWRLPGQTIMVENHPVILQPMYCVQGSFGAEFVPGIQESNFDFIADMGTADNAIPYCAFYDAGAQRDTGLGDFLKKNQVHALSILGLPETIVSNTVEAASAMGFITSTH